MREAVALAGVSRGALYHHFPKGKIELFLAIFDQVEREAIQRVREVRASAPSANSWQAFRLSVRAFVDSVQQPDVQRITLIDGPAVLGWVHWRKLEESHALGTLREALQDAMDAGFIRSRPADPLAHLIFGAIMEAALLIANSPPSDSFASTICDALDALLTGLEG